MDGDVPPLLPTPDMITIENPHIRVMVDPTHGGRIDSIRTPDDAKDWIYASSDAGAQASPTGTDYDDLWAGGFEELFPSDAPGMFEGRALPDHGELWNSQLEVRDQDDLSVDMVLHCRSVPARFEKRISIEPDSARVSIAYGISNLGDQPLHYLFKLHAAMRVAGGDELLLPGGNVTRVSAEFSRLMGAPDGAEWPIVAGVGDEPTDLSIVPERSADGQEFVYVSGLPAGWCGLRRPSEGRQFVMRYSLDDFPHCWLFMALGGWRDHYTVVLEPCTNIPKDLAAAKRAGTCAVLSPGASRSYSVSIDIS